MTAEEMLRLEPLIEEVRRAKVARNRAAYWHEAVTVEWAGEYTAEYLQELHVKHSVLVAANAEYTQAALALADALETP